MKSFESRIGECETYDRQAMLSLWRDLLAEYGRLRKEEGAYSSLRIGAASKLLKESEEGKFPSEALVERAMVQEYGTALIEGHKQQWHSLQFIDAALRFMAACVGGEEKEMESV